VPEPVLTREHIDRAVARFRRRLEELAPFSPDAIRDRSDPSITTLEVSIEEALADALGRGTPSYKNYAPAAELDTAGFNLNGTPLPEIIEGLRRGKSRSVALLTRAISSLEEKLSEMEEPKPDEPAAKALRAYEGLDLHPEIARAASQLYRDGHYAHAVEDSVKALNTLVRLRSGLDQLDGIPLMQQAFSPNNPVLKFNDHKDKSDHDEQVGFMNMFSGAVSGLRNPRAHGFIKDDPERALEFIAFVSLLAKLLDEAKKA
jgi:uncharacterized protein (TIGR02391 family)